MEDIKEEEQVYMKMRQTGHEIARRGRKETGAALISVLLLCVVALILTGALVPMITSGMRGTAAARSAEISYATAQSGIGAAIFQIEAGTAPSTGSLSMEQYLTAKLGAAATGSPRPGTLHFTGSLASGSTYDVALTDPSAGDNQLTLTSVGTETTTGWKRRIVVVARAEPIDALNYAMFGNQINFHNHLKVPNALTLNTSMFSNGSIRIDHGISINGPAQAVNYIQPNQGSTTGPGGVLPNTVLTPAGQQGDPNPMTSDPNAQIVQVVPAPPVQPFPTFDFNQAMTIATAADRAITPAALTTLIANARTYANTLPAGATGTLPAASYPAGVSVTGIPVSVTHYKTSALVPNPRPIAIPNAANPSASIPLGSLDGVSNPAVNTNLFEVDLVGNPLSDTLLYVSGALDLTEPTTTLVQIQGSLIVNGSLGLHSPVEALAWDNRMGPKFVPLGQSLYTDATGLSTVATTAAQAADAVNWDVVYSFWPALAANGQIKVDSSGGGNGGPVHIEGAVYTVAESHFHKSDPYESSYSVGAEIADTIHNCQWFSFAYDPEAQKTLGFFNKAAGRVKLTVVRVEDHN